MSAVWVAEEKNLVWSTSVGYRLGMRPVNISAPENSQPGMSIGDTRRDNCYIPKNLLPRHGFPVTLPATTALSRLDRHAPATECLPLPTFVLAKQPGISYHRCLNVIRSSTYHSQIRRSKMSLLSLRTNAHTMDSIHHHSDQPVPDKGPIRRLHIGQREPADRR